MPLGVGALVAGAALAAVLASAAGAQQGSGEALEEKAAQVRLLIAELDVAGAARELAAFRADKSAEARRLDKELSAELAKAKKIKPAALQIRKLVDAKKGREAAALATSTIDANASALALAGIRKLRAEAWRQAYLVIDDFDGGTFEADWRPYDSKAEVVDDGRGGHAVRWLPVPGSQSLLFRRLKEVVDLDSFDEITFRLRTPRKAAGRVGVRFLNTVKDDYTIEWVAPKVITDWQEVTVALAPFGKKVGKFDRAAVVAFDLAYGGKDSIELIFDDILLVRKAPPR